MTEEGERFHVLVVEDDDDHAELTMFHMKRAVPGIRVTRCEDGAEALEKLLSPTEGELASPLDLVVLDLKLRTMDGLSVLRQVREAEAAQSVPIVVFSTSASEKDVVAAYGYFANSYVVKPAAYKDYQATIEQMMSYWRGYNRRPSRLPG